METLEPLLGSRTIWELVDRRASTTPERTILFDEQLAYPDAEAVTAASRWRARRCPSSTRCLATRP